MSNCAIDWVLSIKLGDPATKIVLLVLANRVDDLGQCWPSRKSISEQTDLSVSSVQRRLNELEKAKLIERKRRRRATTLYQLKIPGLRTANSGTPKQLRSVSAGTPKQLRSVKYHLRSVTADTGNPHLEPSLKKDSPSSADDGFRNFWESYPRKVAKTAADKAFARAIKETTLEQMLAALAIDKQNWKEERFTPHPATWLNQGRYLDHQDKLKPLKTYRPPDYRDD
jgi:DNA-binding transcriptional ArsR family regulator